MAWVVLATSLACLLAATYESWTPWRVMLPSWRADRSRAPAEAPAAALLGDNKRLHVQQQNYDAHNSAVATYDVALTRGRALQQESIDSEVAFAVWRRTYENWIAETTNVIKTHSGHRAAGMFGRCPEHFAVMHSHGFNVDHGGCLTVLRYIVEFLRDLLENTQDLAWTSPRLTQAS